MISASMLQKQSSFSPLAILIGGAFVLSVFVGSSRGTALGMSILTPLLTGWYRYLPRAVSRSHFHARPIEFAVVASVILVAGSHLFLRWISRSISGTTWKLRWSLSLAGLFFLLLFSGMSLMGIAHQTGWLINSPYRLTERRHDADCRSNMHQIGLALLLYTQDFGGQYPPDLSTLAVSEQISPWAFICPSTDDTAFDPRTTQQAFESLFLPNHCSYIYLGNGLRDPLEATRVLLVEPARNHAGDGSTVLYADGHAEWVDREHAIAIFNRYGLTDDDTPDSVRRAGRSFRSIQVRE